MCLPHTQNHNYHAFIWHAVFLSITATFTEVNTVIPALILQMGGSEMHIGLAGAIMIGLPLITKINFTGLLHGKRRKKPYLLLAINLRILSLAAVAVTVIRIHRFSVSTALLIIYSELILFTVSGAFAGVSYVDIIGKSFSTEQRRRFFTRTQLISSVGILISALLARQVLALSRYPYSYAILFLAAAAVLLVASGGFWMIRENPGNGDSVTGYLRTLASIPGVLKRDPNLRTYLFYLNSIGFHVALIPFYVANAKAHYRIDPALIGNLLFFQIAGMVAASLVWPHMVKRSGFKGVLRIWSVLSLILPLAALLIGSFLPRPYYLPLFFFIGVAISARTVTQDSVVVELSTESNRVIYAGIIGAFNLSIALFPIIIGTLISLIGLVPVFAAGSAFSALSLLFLSRLRCPVDMKTD